MKLKQIFKYFGLTDNPLQISFSTGPQDQEILRDFDNSSGQYIDSLDTSTYSSIPRDTVCVNDKSGSMATTDCKPSRLEASKLAAQQFIMRRSESSPGDRIALVSFKEHAKIVLPLTYLYETETIIKYLNSIKAGGGTNINEGLKAAQQILLDDQSLNTGQSRFKRILLLTDGHGGHPIRTARKLKSQRVMIEVIGMGGDPSAVNEQLLRKVATTDRDGTHYRFFKDTDSLVAHYDNLATGIVHRSLNR